MALTAPISIDQKGPRFRMLRIFFSGLYMVANRSLESA